MNAKRILLALTAVCAVGAITFATWAAPRPVVRAGPQLVPVAETRLVMEGLALPNFRGLEKSSRKNRTTRNRGLMPAGKRS